MSNFTPEEEERLKVLLPYVEDIVEDAEYKRSWNVIWKNWRAVILTAAAVLTAIILIWDKFKAFVVWMAR